MNYCTNCGKQLPSNKNFCTKCGTKVKKVEENLNPNTTGELIASTTETAPFAPAATAATAAPVAPIVHAAPNVPVAPAAPVAPAVPVTPVAHVAHVAPVAPAATVLTRNYTPKPMTKKQKLSLIVGGAVAACFLVLYLIGSSLTSKEKVVDNFKKAMTEKKASTVASMLVSSDKRLKIDEAGVKTLFNYLDSTPSYLNNMLDSLDNPNSVISIKKDGKKFLLFDNYVFDVKPAFLHVNTNYKNTKILVDDKEVATANKENFSAEVGPFMPGTHTVKAVLKGDYVDLEKTDMIRTLEYSTSSKDVIPVDLFIEASTLDLNSSNEDAKIFINGKDTGLTVKDSQKLGPIATNGTLKLHIEKAFPFGICKSDEVAITNNYINLNILPSEELENTVMNTITDYLKSKVQSYIALDSTKLVNASEARTKQISDDVDYYKRLEAFYTGKIEKVEFDLSTMAFKNIYDAATNGYQVEVVVKASYDDTTYYAQDTDRTTRKHDDNSIITVVYNENDKKWIVLSDSYTYSYNDDSKSKKIIEIK